MSQQLERVISKPDFIFTACSNLNYPWGFARTGTTNWLNNATINGSSDLAGPGTIVPQITISFHEYGLYESASTGDAPPYNIPSVQIIRWGSFDGSTNAPVIYPTGSGAAQVDTLQAQLSLQDASFASSANLCLHAPVKFGNVAALQTSSNLLDWVSQATVTNFGLPVNWSHVYSRPQGFFRIEPVQ